MAIGVNRLQTRRDIEQFELEFLFYFAPKLVNVAFSNTKDLTYITDKVFFSLNTALPLYET